MIVVDASLMVAYLINETEAETHAQLASIIEHENVLVPPHWVAEVGNALATNLRRGRISIDSLEEMLSSVSKLPISVFQGTTHIELVTTIDIAIAGGLTFYDASYVKLAAENNATLATFDNAMRLAAVQYSVELFPSS